MKHLIYLITALLLALSPLGMMAQEEIAAGQVAGDTVEPKPLNLDIVKAAIGYPERARDAELEGIVKVIVWVDSKGNVVRHLMIQSPHPILTRAVEDQIGFLRFAPGTINGKPTSTRVTIPFSFDLLTRREIKQRQKQGSHE